MNYNDPNEPDCRHFMSWHSVNAIPTLADDVLLGSLRYAAGRPGVSISPFVAWLSMEAQKRPRLVPQLVAMKLKGLI